jgi:hypothetical protein
MKWNNIFHALGAIGCIAGMYAFHNNGWVIFQWPAIALLWIINSYINASTANRANRKADELHKDLMHNIEELAKADTRAWAAEMKLAKAGKK